MAGAWSAGRTVLQASAHAALLTDCQEAANSNPGCLFRLSQLMYMCPLNLLSVTHHVYAALLMECLNWAANSKPGRLFRPPQMLCLCVLNLFTTTPHVSVSGVGCMLGAMAAQPKVRKVAQRQQKTKLGVLEKPQEVKHIDTEQKQVCDKCSLACSRRSLIVVSCCLLFNVYQLCCVCQSSAKLHCVVDMHERCVKQ